MQATGLILRWLFYYLRPIGRINLGMKVSYAPDRGDIS